MSREIPKLHNQAEPHERYKFQDSRDFPYDLWLPTLIEITEVTTLGDQQDAMTAAIVNVGASRHGLYATTKGRLGLHVSGLEARINYEPNMLHEIQGLSYLLAGGIAIGYQSPDEEKPRRAFAVVDDPAYGYLDGSPGYHRVVHGPEEELYDKEKQLGLNVVWALAAELSFRYPDFYLFDKLEDQGIPMPPEDNY